MGYLPKGHVTSGSIMGCRWGTPEQGCELTNKLKTLPSPSFRYGQWQESPFVANCKRHTTHGITSHVGVPSPRQEGPHWRRGYHSLWLQVSSQPLISCPFWEGVPQSCHRSCPGGTPVLSQVLLGVLQDRGTTGWGTKVPPPWGWETDKQTEIITFPNPSDTGGNKIQKIFPIFRNSENSDQSFTIAVFEISFYYFKCLKNHYLHQLFGGTMWRLFNNYVYLKFIF